MPFVPHHRRPALLAVLALHLLLWLGLRQPSPWTPWTPWTDRAPRPARPVSPLLWLLPPPATPQPAAEPARPRASTPPQRSLQPPPEPPALTLLPPPAPASAEAVPTPPPAAGVASSTPPPLDLRLPTGPNASWRRPRHPALDDPRVVRPRANGIEDRVAAALGGGDEIIEEHLADGLMRFRRGSRCVLVWPNRAERVDPFNSSFSPKPRLVEAC
jgi:hypothetical protein